MSNGNRGGKWYALGSEGFREPKGNGGGMEGNLPFGITDPNLMGDASAIAGYPGLAMGAANVWRQQLGEGYPGLESLMRANAMTDFPGFSPADKEDQNQNYRQLAAKTMAARLARGDPEALEALEQIKKDYAMGKLSDVPTVFDDRAADGDNYEMMAEMPKEQQERLVKKAFSVGAMIPNPVTGQPMPWSVKALDHFNKNWMNHPENPGSPATMFVATDGEAGLIASGTDGDPYVGLAPESLTPQQHLAVALNLRRQTQLENNAYVIEYPFSHHFVRHVLSEVNKEKATIQAEARQKSMRASILPGTASEALEPATGIAGALVKNAERRASIANSMRDAARALVEGERKKAEASLTEVAQGIDKFFKDESPEDDSSFVSAFNMASSTRKPHRVQAKSPRTMAAVWVGRQKKGDVNASPYASGVEAKALFDSKLTDFMNGMPDASAKARSIAAGLSRDFSEHFAKIGFSDLTKSVKDGELQFRPVVLDVNNYDARWARNNGLQAVMTPGHVGAEAPSNASSFEALFTRGGFSAAAPMNVGYKFDEDAPAMTIVGYAARARKELTMTDLHGKERVVPEGTRLLSGALLVRDGNRLTKYSLLTHNPGSLRENNGIVDNHGEVFRFWDPHHADQQGGFAFNSEATIKDATGDDSTRSGSMFLVFDE